MPPYAPVHYAFSITLSTSPYSLASMRGHEVIAICILLDPFQSLPCTFGQDLFQLVAHAEDAFGANFDVAGLPFGSAERLMDHHFAVRQSETLAFGSGCQQERAHRCSHADANGRDVRLDILHRIVDRHPCGNRTARTVDVQVDVLLRIFSSQEQQLRDNRIGYGIVDRGTEER